MREGVRPPLRMQEWGSCIRTQPTLVDAGAFWAGPLARRKWPRNCEADFEGELSSRMGVWDEITTAKGFRRNYVRWLETPRK